MKLIDTQHFRSLNTRRAMKELAVRRYDDVQGAVEVICLMVTLTLFVVGVPKMRRVFFASYPSFFPSFYRLNLFCIFQSCLYPL